MGLWRSFLNLANACARCIISIMIAADFNSLALILNVVDIVGKLQ